MQHQNKAAREENWSTEQKEIHEKLLKFCSCDPQEFWDKSNPMQEIETLHDNGVRGSLIPCTPQDE